MANALDVWLYGTRIATLTRDLSDRISLVWTDDALDRWGRGSRVLSSKLPVGEPIVPSLVGAWINGLLPEGNARTNYALSAGVAPTDTFGLLRAYGRDVPGATIVVESGQDDPTRHGHYELLTDAEVADRLRRADEHSPADPRQTGESSMLPGMVPKITVHRGDRGEWYACKNGAASTWIIKRGAPPDAPLVDLIDTEVACLWMAKTFGLTTIDAEIVDFGDVRGIGVSRYDRVSVDDGDPRLHQEDLAQSLGLNTDNPDRKFQWGSQTPSLKQAADVLRIGGGNQDDLLRLVAFSHVVGNTDMHAKNISFLHYPDGRIALSPAYDIAMHLHHERDNRRFALDVNGKFLVSDVTIEDVILEGVSWGLPLRRALNVVLATVVDTSLSFAELDRSELGGVLDEAWDYADQRVQASLREANAAAEKYGARK